MIVNGLYAKDLESQHKNTTDLSGRQLIDDVLINFGIERAMIATSVTLIQTITERA